MIHLVLNEMMTYFGTDAYQINHALKVYGFASTIGRTDKLDANSIEILETAAILHDIGIPESEKKYGSSMGKYQEIEGPPIARVILEKLKVAPAAIDRVCFLIGNHHTYTKIDKIDFQILVEADFLVNIFENSMDGKMIESIYEKYFKTKTGISILETMYKL
jgi:HD superfamily phosphodiesterase